MRTPDDIRTCVVCVNSGSGVILQPGKGQTYILTANHVFFREDENENKFLMPTASILYYNTRENKYKPIEQSVKLKPGVNYFPWPSSDMKESEAAEEADIAILIINKEQIPNWIKPQTEIDFEGAYILGGIPKLRRDTYPHPEWYRDDTGITISQVKKSAMMLEAKNPTGVTLKALRGMSGGGLFQLSGNKIYLFGIQNQGPIKDEDQGRFKFTPIDVFKYIIEAYRDKLLPFLTVEGETEKGPREVVSIPLYPLNKEYATIKAELITTLKQKARKAVIDWSDKDWSFFDDCSEILYQNFNVAIDEPTRVEVIKSIGESIFKVLSSSKPYEMDLVSKMLKKNGHLCIELVTTSKPIPETPSIPWEFMKCPADDIKEYTTEAGEKFPATVLFTRRIGVVKQALPFISPEPLLSTLSILFLVSGNFRLNGEGDSEDSGKDLLEELGIRGSQTSNAIRIQIKVKDLTAFIQENSREESKFSPNVIHLIGDIGDSRGELLKKIKSSVLKKNEERLFLLVQQSSANDRDKDGIHKVFDQSAYYFLEMLKVPVIVSLPYSMQTKNEYELLGLFYSDIAEGTSIGESFFTFSNNLVKSNPVARPILYLSNSDFSFLKKPPERGLRDNNTNPDEKTEESEEPFETRKGTKKPKETEESTAQNPLQVVIKDLDRYFNDWKNSPTESVYSNLIEVHKELRETFKFDEKGIEGLSSRHKVTSETAAVNAYRTKLQLMANDVLIKFFGYDEDKIKELIRKRSDFKASLPRNQMGNPM